MDGPVCRAHECTVPTGPGKVPGYAGREGSFVDASLRDGRISLHIPETVSAWATAEARYGERGVIDPAAEEVRAANDTLAFESSVEQLRARPGLDPISDADLARSRPEAVL
jgi:hypothetical protein